MMKQTNEETDEDRDEYRFEFIIEIWWCKIGRHWQHWPQSNRIDCFDWLNITFFFIRNIKMKMDTHTHAKQTEYRYMINHSQWSNQMTFHLFAYIIIIIINLFTKKTFQLEIQNRTNKQNKIKKKFKTSIYNKLARLDWSSSSS